MSRSFYFGNYAELQAGSQNFATKISSAPVSYGLSAPQAAAYQTLNDLYSDAYFAAVDPEQRTRGIIAARNVARRNLIAMAADLARIINGTSTVTDAQKFDLGISVRGGGAPLPIPTQMPALEIVSRLGTGIRIRLHAGEGRRSRPAGVQGTRVYSFVGTSAPTDPKDWVLEGQATRSFVDLDFSGKAPGTIVWLTAQYYNPRGETGPACAPVSTPIAGGTANVDAA